MSSEFQPGSTYSDRSSDDTDEYLSAHSASADSLIFEDTYDGFSPIKAKNDILEHNLVSLEDFQLTEGPAHQDPAMVEQVLHDFNVDMFESGENPDSESPTNFLTPVSSELTITECDNTGSMSDSSENAVSNEHNENPNSIIGNSDSNSKHDNMLQLGVIKKENTVKSRLEGLLHEQNDPYIRTRIEDILRSNSKEVLDQKYEELAKCKAADLRQKVSSKGILTCKNSSSEAIASAKEAQRRVSFCDNLPKSSSEDSCTEEEVIAHRLFGALGIKFPVKNDKCNSDESLRGMEGRQPSQSHVCAVKRRACSNDSLTSSSLDSVNEHDNVDKVLSADKQHDENNRPSLREELAQMEMFFGLRRNRRGSSSYADDHINVIGSNIPEEMCEGKEENSVTLDNVKEQAMMLNKGNIHNSSHKQDNLKGETSNGNAGHDSDKDTSGSGSDDRLERVTVYDRMAHLLGTHIDPVVVQNEPDNDSNELGDILVEDSCPDNLKTQTEIDSHDDAFTSGSSASNKDFLESMKKSNKEVMENETLESSIKKCSLFTSVNELDETSSDAYFIVPILFENDTFVKNEECNENTMDDVEQHIGNVKLEDDNNGDNLTLSNVNDSDFNIFNPISQKVVSSGSLGFVFELGHSIEDVIEIDSNTDVTLKDNANSNDSDKSIDLITSHSNTQLVHDEKSKTYRMRKCGDGNDDVENGFLTKHRSEEYSATGIGMKNDVLKGFMGQSKSQEESLKYTDMLKAGAYFDAELNSFCTYEGTQMGRHKNPRDCHSPTVVVTPPNMCSPQRHWILDRESPNGNVYKSILDAQLGDYGMRYDFSPVMYSLNEESGCQLYSDDIQFDFPNMIEKVVKSKNASGEGAEACAEQINIPNKQLEQSSFAHKHFGGGMRRNSVFLDRPPNLRASTEDLRSRIKFLIITLKSDLGLWLANNKNDDPDVAESIAAHLEQLDHLWQLVCVEFSERPSMYMDLSRVYLELDLFRIKWDSKSIADWLKSSGLGMFIAEFGLTILIGLV